MNLNKKEYTINCEGFPLKVIIEGQGTPLLIIGSAVYYDRVFSSNLRQHFQCIFIDHRGFSLTKSISNSNVSLATTSQDIEKIRTTLNIKGCSILGHSGHAYMALDYAKRYPKYITHVIICSASPNLSHLSLQAAEDHWLNNASSERKAQFHNEIMQLENDITLKPQDKFISICCRMQAKRWLDIFYDETWLWQGLQTHTLFFDKMWGEIFANINITDYTSSIQVPVYMHGRT